LANQIVKHGLETRANTLRSSTDPEYSVRDIARILSTESGQKINFQTVQRYFTKNKDPVIQKVQARTEVVAAAVQERLDTIKQLREVNEDTRQILKQLKDPDGNVLGGVSGGYLALAAIQRIEKQLELQAKLLGDLPTQPTINITVVENQFNEFKTAIVGVMCPECQRRLAELLRARMGP